jgi:hypothetical protein
MLVASQNAFSIEIIAILRLWHHRIHKLNKMGNALPVSAIEELMLIMELGRLGPCALQQRADNY